VTPAAKSAPAASAGSDPAPTALHDFDRAKLDAAIADLRLGALSWSRLTLGQRARLLERTHATTAAAAEEWADTAAVATGMEPGHPRRGEEWLPGPYAALVALDAYRETLESLADGANPLDRVRMDAAPGGRIRAHAFPLHAADAVLVAGHSGEVWFEPGVSLAQAREAAGLGQRTPTVTGGVGLVLGAGNVTSIAVLDVLYELLAHNRVVLLKVNPTHDVMVPVYERALAPLIEPGFVRIVRGGADVGAFLTEHDGIDHVHITGATATFDAIVWGTGAEAERRRAADDPKMAKPITAELGGVSPIIVVPGRWSDADLRYQAEHIVTMRLYNSGHNCLAGQVVVVSAHWPQRQAFLAALREALADAPERPVWYPGSDARQEAAVTSYPDATRHGDGARLLIEIGPGHDPSDIETIEYFAPVLGVISLPGEGQEFLDAAVAYANARLTGTLGANVLIDPTTQDALGDGFERAIADLRYGAVSINSWTALAFLTPTLTWGAYPGGTPADVGSGIGIVHNALLLDGVERTVTRGPFRPFPRSLPRGIRARSLSAGIVLPKPPWFVHSRTGAAVSEGFTRFRMDGNLPRLARTFVQALRA
jgi:acyl-CoA reductase-like NAD-dependent aldehyde dehydrogenase